MKVPLSVKSGSSPCAEDFEVGLSIHEQNRKGDKVCRLFDEIDEQANNFKIDRMFPDFTSGGLKAKLALMRVDGNKEEDETKPNQLGEAYPCRGDESDEEEAHSENGASSYGS